MKAKMFCPTHGKLTFDEIIIKNGIPICARCSSPLEFGIVKPRKLKSLKKKRKRRK